MKFLVLIILISCFSNGYTQEEEGLDLFLAANSEIEIQHFLNFVQELDSSNQCGLALHGTALAMSASFGYNPITKLNRFSQGKKLIESGISQSSFNPCPHFCRLAVQSQSPGFLDYDEHIESDAVIVTEALSNGWLLDQRDTRKGLIEFMINETQISAGLKAKLEKL
jgi:hypothetical protein